MDNIEIITKNKKIIAYIIHHKYTPEKTSFFTPKQSNLQVGYVIYKGKSEIPRHVHCPIKRHLDHTEEVLIVKKGRAVIELYDDAKIFISSHPISRGDIIILISGGHGFKIESDTILIEIKQGPYTGIDEKERF